MTPPKDHQGPRVSFAQNGEDVRLWRVFDSLDDGFYVEVGAYEPESDSISRSFYNRGWSGVVVEPVAEAAQHFREERPRDSVVECLAGEEAGEAEFTVFPGTGLSTAVPRFAERHAADGLEHHTLRAPVRRLDDILDEYASSSDIQFMMVDVEGAEESVLRGFDFGRYRPWVLIVESTEPRSTVKAVAWRPLLLDNGYQEVVFDGLNSFYVSSEHEELAALLVDPPNVLDNYITYQHAYALDQWGKAAEDAATARAQLGSMKAQLDSTTLQLHAAEAERDSHRSIAQDLEARLAALRESVSWRITAPLRKVRGRRS